MKTSLVLLALVLALYACATGQVLERYAPTKSIYTDGGAKVWVAPDRARLFLGVETQDEALEGARQGNAATISRIMGALEDLNIEDLSVQSPAYKVALIKEDSDVARQQMRIPKIIGYRVTQEFTVLLKNDDMEALSRDAGLVLDAALISGVNIIDEDILFFKEDISSAKEEALKLAVEDAMARAEAIAATAHAKIKTYSTIRSGFSVGSDYDRYAQVAQVSTPMAAEDAASTIVAAKVPVRAGVALSCILR
jgi:uncharacterized protein YggE